jgi:hypothetical protein
MRKIIGCGLAFVICILGYAPLLLQAEKLAEFREPFSFPLFAIDEDRIYVWDDSCVVHIYSRKDFAQLNQFGRKGQGPAEFQFINYIHVLPDRLCIGQGQKLSYFSKNGEFLKTITYPNPDTGTYIPLGSNFVGTRYLPDDPKSPLATMAVNLYDSKFKLVKELYRADIHKFVVYNFEKEKRDVWYVRDRFRYEVCDDRLYIGNTGAGFFFAVFNGRGERLYDINRSYEKRKISGGDIKKMMAELREALGEQEFNRRKSIINEYLFAEYYPAYEDFRIAEGKIYVFSYPVPNRPIVTTIMDPRGNLLREIEIPGSERHGLYGYQSYCVYKGKYYHMLYNYESDKWELHVENLSE